MKMVILAINQALGAQPVLLAMMLLLGAVMMVRIGPLFASLASSVMTFFPYLKMFEISLYVPVFIYMFPRFPIGPDRSEREKYVVQ